MRPKVRLTKRNVLLVLMGFAVVTSFAPPWVSQRLRGPMQLMMAPIGDGGMYLVRQVRLGGVGSSGKRLSQAEINSLAEENSKLQEVTRDLRMRLADEKRKLAAHERITYNIRSTYGPKTGLACELIPARVVAEGSLAYSQGRVVNAGRTQGATPGASVTTRRLLTDRSKAIAQRRSVLGGSKLPSDALMQAPAALVGRLIDASAFTAQVQLVTDRGFVLQAMVRRDPSVGYPRKIESESAGGAASVVVLTPANEIPIPVLARGDGVDGMIVKDVPAKHNVLPGDKLYTSGRNAALPIEVLIGTVTKVTPYPQNQLFVTLQISPFAELGKLRDVYIVEPYGGGN